MICCWLLPFRLPPSVKELKCVPKLKSDSCRPGMHGIVDQSQLMVQMQTHTRKFCTFSHNILRVLDCRTPCSFPAVPQHLRKNILIQIFFLKIKLLYRIIYLSIILLLHEIVSKQLVLYLIIMINKHFLRVS